MGTTDGKGEATVTRSLKPSPADRPHTSGPSDPLQGSGEHGSESTALLEELRATFTRLLASFEAPGAIMQAELGTNPAKEAPSPAASTPVESASELKALLQLRARRRRQPFGQFHDWPAWDMLLDLAAVRAEGGHVSVSSVCISSGAPQSTALRKLAAMESANLVRRYFHGTDRRRVCITLTDTAVEMVMSTLREDAAFFRAAASAS
jgi:hypothetical protein